MAKRIVFSRKAFLDIDRIIEFNNRRNQSDTYSRKFLIKLHKRLKLLQRHPLTGLKPMKKMSCYWCGTNTTYFIAVTI